MASNAQLKKEITELGVSLELQIDTEGLSNAKLAKLLSDLKFQKKGTSDEATGQVIAEGKSIITKRGILGPGDAVFESDFADEEAFSKFQKTEHIVPAKG